jgi:chromosome segregation ATPase
MSDIVERLDKRANEVTPWATCCGEARDEIKRLRAALKEILDDVEPAAQAEVELSEENDRLIAEIERLRQTEKDCKWALDEIERLRAHGTSILKEYGKAQEEIERLRAENETLRAIEAGMEAVEAEIERLRAAEKIWRDGCNRDATREEELRAEIERLRAERPFLEVAELRVIIKQLRAERDELLAALKELVEIYDLNPGTSPIVERARRAVAKAESKK